MNYEERDSLGMYKRGITGGAGPDMRTGAIGYAVLSFGGFLGMGEKLFAVPWSALSLDTTKKRFILNVEKERLKDAPGFDTDHWPNMVDDSWANEVHSFYRTRH